MIRVRIRNRGLVIGKNQCYYLHSRRLYNLQRSSLLQPRQREDLECLQGDMDGFLTDLGGLGGDDGDDDDGDDDDDDGGDGDDDRR